MTIVLAVTLSGNDDSQFRGFFLQARKPNDNTASHGTFNVDGNSDAQTLDCFTKTDVSRHGCSFSPTTVSPYLLADIVNSRRINASVLVQKDRNVRWPRRMLPPGESLSIGSAKMGPRQTDRQADRSLLYGFPLYECGECNI